VVKPRRLNARSDHLSRITNGEEPSKLEENILDAQSFLVRIADKYFVDIIEFFITRFSPKKFNIKENKNMMEIATDYQLIAGHLCKLCVENILRRCVMEHERTIILEDEHEGIV
jgi:hypothetical protein